MKVFRKMFAFAVTVAAIAMATSAFAATAVYDETAGAPNPLVKVADTAALAGETGQATVAVVPTNFGEEGTTDAEAIYYIDQDDVEVIKTNLVNGLKIKGAIADRSQYAVRVAGTNTAMTQIEFAAVQPDEDGYEIVGKVGKDLEEATAVGIKGTFKLNKANVQTVYVTVQDAKNGNKTGVVEWDLSAFRTNADITFGLEIQSETPRDLSGISIVSVSDEDPRV